MNQSTLQAECSSSDVLFMALELSAKEWRVVFGTRAGKHRQVCVPARDLGALGKAIIAARDRFGLDADVHVVSCYEAGRDGFWLHRWLVAEGAENFVVDSSSILVDRRLRRAKSDALDAKQLLHLLVRYQAGDPVWRTVRVPTEEQEDLRRHQRELQRLKQERLAHRARIKSLLYLHGIAFEEKLPVPAACITALGTPLPPGILAELEREQRRLDEVQEQISEVERERRERLKAPTHPMHKVAEVLMLLRGIGVESACTLSFELFGWRDFENRRQVASAAGLVPTPYNSGSSEREQGISKAGNRRVRALMVELAWMWLRLQPGSASSQWFQRRFANGKRSRRIGIVGLARRLLVELWRFATMGVIPEGAELKPTA